MIEISRAIFTQTLGNARFAGWWQLMLDTVVAQNTYIMTVTVTVTVGSAIPCLRSIARWGLALSINQDWWVIYLTARGSLICVPPNLVHN
jgi:hypothetical protein